MDLSVTCKLFPHGGDPVENFQGGPRVVGEASRVERSQNCPFLPPRLCGPPLLLTRSARVVVRGALGSAALLIDERFYSAPHRTRQRLPAAQVRQQGSSHRARRCVFAPTRLRRLCLDASSDG